MLLMLLLDSPLVLLFRCCFYSHLPVAVRSIFCVVSMAARQAETFRGERYAQKSCIHKTGNENAKQSKMVCVTENGRQKRVKNKEELEIVRVIESGKRKHCHAGRQYKVRFVFKTECKRGLYSRT